MNCYTNLKNTHANSTNNEQQFHAESFDKRCRDTGRQDEYHRHDGRAERGRDAGPSHEEDALRVEQHDINTTELLPSRQPSRDDQTLAVPHSGEQVHDRA